jgi:hypothetical protein
MWVGGQHHATAALIQGMTRIVLYRRRGVVWGSANKTGNIRLNVVLRRVRVTIATVEKQ